MMTAQSRILSKHKTRLPVIIYVRKLRKNRGYGSDHDFTERSRFHKGLASQPKRAPRILPTSRQVLPELVTQNVTNDRGEGVSNLADEIIHKLMIEERPKL